MLLVSLLFAPLLSNVLGSWLEMKEEKLQLTPQKYKYVNKMDNLQGTDKFLGMCSLPLTQEERENMDRPITGNDIESIIKKLPTNRSPGPDDLTGKYYKILNEELSLVFLKLVQKNWRARNASNLICEVIITLIPKLDKDTKKERKKENYRLIILMNTGASVFTWKVLNKILTY